MGMDAISAGMLATSAFQGYQQYQAGKEADQMYRIQAGELANRTAYAQRMALEESKELTREGRSAESKAVAAAGASGLRVGGSVVTLTDAIRAKVERRKALIGMEFNETARRNAFGAWELRRAGWQAKQTGMINAGNSLLAGGLETARMRYEYGPKITTKEYKKTSGRMMGGPLGAYFSMGGK